MATINGLKVNIQSTSTGIQRRKIQHKIYGMDGAIIEDTGRDLFTYNLSVICAGDSWEKDRDALEEVLDSSGVITVNQEDLGYISCELISYSMEESRVLKGLTTFSIELIESLVEVPNIVSLDSNLSFLDKLKDAYEKYEGAMSAASKYKGKILGVATQIRGYISEVLNVPSNLLSANKSFSKALFEQIGLVPLNSLLGLQEVDFIPVIPNNPIEYQKSIELQEAVKGIAFLKTIEAIAEKEPFETLEETLEFNKKLQQQYTKRLQASEPELQHLLTDVYVGYLESFNTNSKNLKSIHRFKTQKALLIGLFEESPTTDFDSLFSIQTIAIDDLFGQQNQKEFNYIK